MHKIVFFSLAYVFLCTRFLVCLFLLSFIHSTLICGASTVPEARERTFRETKFLALTEIPSQTEKSDNETQTHNETLNKTFSVKGHVINHLGFVGHTASVLSTQLWPSQKHSYRRHVSQWVVLCSDATLWIPGLEWSFTNGILILSLYCFFEGILPILWQWSIRSWVRWVMRKKANDHPARRK